MNSFPLTAVPSWSIGKATHDFVSRLLIFGIGFQLALLVPTIPAFVLDERVFNGINIWTKPLKFQLSQILFLATALWMLPMLSSMQRQSRAAIFATTSMVAGSAFEIAYITLQSARGRGSHYYHATSIESAMYYLMGFGATMMVLGSFVFGVLLLRAHASPNREGLRFGSALGMLSGSVLTLVTASVLAAGSGHWVGGALSDAAGLPLVGWSTTGGDMRVPHFFATHLMQALPAAGLLADRLLPALVRVVALGAMGVGCLVVLATYLQARSGLPFWPL